MRGVTRVVCVVGAGSLLAGCGVAGGESRGGTDPNGVVRASWSDPQRPIEPGNTNEVQGGKVLGLITRGLTRYDPKTAESVNDLAESIETEDSRVWRIRLREGLRFSDGTPVTARSFTDAWNYTANITNKQVNAPFFQYVEGYADVHPADETARPRAKTMSGLKVTGPRTFEVRLTQRYATWAEGLGYQAFAPLPRLFFEDHAAWLRRPVGNGPYKVESYRRGKAMKLVADPAYRGPDKARNGGVELVVYTDPNTAYADLLAGNLDVADDIPAAQLPNAAADLGDRFVVRPAGIIQTVSFPFYDRAWRGARAAKVRRGISMAIDRDAITKRIFNGTRIPAKDWTSPVLGAKGGYDASVCGEVCSYDPKKARRLIEEGGGLPGGKLVLTSNVDTGSHRDWMDAVCHSVDKALGREHSCVVNPVGTFADYRTQVTDRKMTGPFRAGWQMDYPNIENFLSKLYYTDASSNDGGHSNPEFDRLIDQANAAPSAAAAVAGFKDAERILARDVPAIPLWYQNGSAGFSERVRDVALDPFSVPVYQAITVTR
ncbi:Oligopeptide-binding protein OppA [Streptomyces sp. RB5]|uniref:Oligopeptide-binding protein OppA n=1 Tax=Streptomyces smaragdinus TaxID=2585196 RepID=A0A7K0CJD4_9ACTN|nr:ABC transporter substrate-binding protein [Streptomyces smaragdinus]MQY13568.1 Oligopeptide-binding protein OppA [Streptomyces smaragdinus]